MFVHWLVGGLSHDLHLFINPKWCLAWISSTHRIYIYIYIVGICPFLRGISPTWVDCPLVSIKPSPKTGGRAACPRELGLELFPLSSGCRLCVRQSGGPQLRLLSSSLEDHSLARGARSWAVRQSPDLQNWGDVLV